MTKRSNGEFKIEKGVPVPPKRGHGDASYPFMKMVVGDSVFIPGKTPQTISGSTMHAALKIGGSAKFATRTVDGGVRVWRIA